MRRPRPLTGAALAAFTVAAAVTGFAAVPAAFADTSTASTLYVNNTGACSDSGAGTQAQPFCSIQAAADVVVPGQTVRIEQIAPADVYTQAVRLTRSGTPSAPITFTGAPLIAGHAQGTIKAPAGQVPLTLSGVHDVNVSSLTLENTGAEGLDVAGSSDVTVDQVTQAEAASTPVSDGVDIDGASSGVTVSRSRLYIASGADVRIASGASHIVLTTNIIRDASAGVVADGVTGLDVTSNGFNNACGPDVQLTGGTSGYVENNQFSANPPPASCASPSANVVVSADSASGVTSDYNAFSPNDLNKRPEYDWAGTTYATTGAFGTATGQAAHDIIIGYAPAGSSLIDSANADAPGELSTDGLGTPRSDDPSVANTGAGSVTYADRGASEAHDEVTVPATVAASPTQGAVPFTASVPVGGATSLWSEPLTYSVDFGDGSDPVTGTAANPPTHTYTTPGAYTETVTVTDADGISATRSTKVIAATASAATTPLSVQPGTAQQGVEGGLADFTFPTDDAFQMASQTLSFGDGNSEDVSGANGSVQDVYNTPGDYTATLTQTDVLGRTSTAKVAFRATDTYHEASGNTPVTVTIPANGTSTVTGQSLGLNGGDPVVLRFNVTGAKDGGWLTAYPAGGTRPSASTLNFPAGQNASNQETLVPSASGDVSLFNGAAAPITVKVTVVGGLSTLIEGGTYHPTNPTTLIDTRYGTGGITGPVGAGKSVTVQVAGLNGVPADATSAVLDVAENTTKAAGSLTVAPYGEAGMGLTASYWNTGASVTNLVTVPLSGGKVTLTNNSTGTANLIAALAGWYTGDATGSGGWPVTPTRVLNTQTGLGETGGKPLELAAGGTLKVKVAGTAGLPATGLTAADLNLTVSAPTASGWLVAYPDGTTRPTAGALNYTKGHTIAGQALIKVGSDGYVDLYNPTSTAINVFADIHGAYVTTTPAS